MSELIVKLTREKPIDNTGILLHVLIYKDIQSYTFPLNNEINIRNCSLLIDINSLYDCSDTDKEVGIMIDCILRGLETSINACLKRL